MTIASPEEISLLENKFYKACIGVNERNKDRTKKSTTSEMPDDLLTEEVILMMTRDVDIKRDCRVNGSFLVYI
jgi:hypothetical protein